MLAEQLWDADDLPDGKMQFGRPSGSAMPLCWSHAEYLSLVRSRRDGQVFDRVDPAFQRYVVGGKRDSSHEIWTFRHRTQLVPAGRTLRLILQAPAKVRWTSDGWANSTETETASAGFQQLFFVDLPTANLTEGAQVEWTFFWLESNSWEDGENFRAQLI
jgi:glucoamylase